MWGQTLQLAFQKGDPQFAPGYAGIHYRAGRIKLLEGCPEEARQHFEKAIKLADYSAYSQLSRQALADL